MKNILGEALQVTGILKIQLVNEDGTIDHIEGHNLVVDLGRTNLVKLMGGDAAGLAITKIGVGTGSASPTSSDSGLTSAFTKNLNTAGTVNIYTVNSVKFGYQIDTTEANGMTINEFGLFNSAGVLVARKTLSTSITKTSAFAIAGTWTITVS